MCRNRQRFHSFRDQKMNLLRRTSSVACASNANRPEARAELSKCLHHNAVERGNSLLATGYLEPVSTEW